MQAGGATAIDEWSSGRIDAATTTAAPAWGVGGAEFGRVGVWDDTAGQGYFIDSTPKTGPPFSMSAWINLAATADTNGVMSNADTASGSRYHFMSVNSSAQFRAISSGGGASETAVGATTLSLGRWYHVAAVWKTTSDRRVYVNGVQDGIDTDPVNVNTPDEVGIGLRHVNVDTDEFNGQITDARFYSRALTPSEIKAMYDVATRWELYERPRLVVGVAAPAAGADLIEPPLTRSFAIPRAANY